MRPKHPSSLLPVAIMLAAMAVMLTTSAWAAPKYRVLHAFGGGNDGAGVWDSVTIDASGNVYGTTSGRGVYGGGTVFRLTPGSTGHWSETILHNFGWQNDGAGPLGGVLIGPSGVLYGTTETGGGPRTGGIVYSLSPGSTGWRETVLHRFRFGDRAGSSWGNVVMDQSGNLYGSGSSVFELSPGQNGWAETILHKFVGGSGDGSGPKLGRSGMRPGIFTAPPSTAAGAMNATAVVERLGSCRPPRRVRARWAGPNTSCTGSATAMTGDFRVEGNLRWITREISMARPRAEVLAVRVPCSS